MNELFTLLFGISILQEVILLMLLENQQGCLIENIYIKVTDKYVLLWNFIELICLIIKRHSQKQRNIWVSQTLKNLNLPLNIFFIYNIDLLCQLFNFNFCTLPPTDICLLRVFLITYKLNLFELNPTNSDTLPNQSFRSHALILLILTLIFALIQPR